jgi:hypothetical protein
MTPVDPRSIESPGDAPDEATPDDEMIDPGSEIETDRPSRLPSGVWRPARDARGIRDSQGVTADAEDRLDEA